MKFGPAFLVTAAFIGPGTVITASLAGANFGFVLLWALLFSLFATLILQEMTARLGIITGKGLGENLVVLLTNPIARFITVALVISAIVIGNAAYEGGNLAGAGLGLNAMFGNLALSEQINIWPLLIALIALILLFSGSYKLVEKAMIALVVIMSLSFLLTFLLVSPNVPALLQGLLIPTLPTGSVLTVVALIGTTVVPYNLFLHASAVSQKWQMADAQPNSKAIALLEARKDLYCSIPIGGLISIAIVSTAAMAFFGHQIDIMSAADIAPALAPLFGDYAGWFIALGLFAAGISSAITAPLAAAYALNGVLNKNWSMQDKGFKAVWLIIIVLGAIPATLGLKPIRVIWFAQVANGILLPILTLFLLYVMNSKLLGKHKNTLWQNGLGLTVFIITLILSGRSLMSAFNLL